jgi:hypothetical protein
MRKVVLAAVLVALLIPAAAAAKSPPLPPTPTVLCGPGCDPGAGGSTGCWQQEWWRAGGLQYVMSYRHFVVVHWCKVNGRMTSLSIEAHGCDTSGLGTCSTGEAWVSAGGVGAGWASIEAHAQVSTTVPKFFGYSVTDILTFSIASG